MECSICGREVGENGIGFIETSFGICLGCLQKDDEFICDNCVRIINDDIEEEYRRNNLGEIRNPVGCAMDG